MGTQGGTSWEKTATSEPLILNFGKLRDSRGSPKDRDLGSSGHEIYRKRYVQKGDRKRSPERRNVYNTKEKKKTSKR